MVTYNPKEWLRPLIQFHRGDTFRKLLPLLGLVGVYTLGVDYFILHHTRLAEAAHFKNIPVMHSLLGIAISMLLVFRTNTAYDRWWEGRKLWGNLLNCSRNLAVKLSVMLPADDEHNRKFFSKLLALFPCELQRHLQAEKTRLEMDTEPHPEIPGFDRGKHVPSQVVATIQGRIHQLMKNGQISGEQLIVLNTEMVAFLDICGGCERIKNTPIPYTYSTFIKKFIFLYVLTLPLGYVFLLGYMSIPVVILIFYVLASLEVIAEEIEDPFGSDANDLPMERISNSIKNNTEQILL